MSLTSEEFQQLFRTFRSTVFRLETRDTYMVAEEADEFEAFRAGRGLPEYSMRTSPWLMNVARTTASGKRWTRVHFARLPHSDYLEFELVSLESNAAAGEDVRIVSLDQHPDLAPLTQDWWGFDLDTDHGFVVWMRYDHDGRIVSRDRSAAPDDLDRCRRERDRVIAASVPLYSYRAATSILSGAA